MSRSGDECGIFQANPSTSRGDAEGRLQDALLKTHNAIKELLGEAESCYCLVYYKIGVHCLAAKNGDGHGSIYIHGAVKRLADALSKGKTWMFDHTNVAAVCVENEFRGLVHPSHP